jgi:hypothetical protein
MIDGVVKPLLKIGEFSTSFTRRPPSNVWFSGGAVKPA